MAGIVESTLIADPTPDPMSTDPKEPVSSTRTTPELLLGNITAARFRTWYQERKYTQNIEAGTPYFNNAGFQPDPEQHSPSKLLRCHRRLFYQDNNAPEEEPDPEGIFWVGSKFEEEIVFPFLKREADNHDAYVQNSIWVDYSIETPAGDVQIKGTTDPVIVDEDAVPILPTEIKTKNSLSSVSSPNRTHRAQLHAYLVGLSKKFDVDLTTGVILYGSRQSFDVKVFRVEFDASFWTDEVLNWATEHTQYRISDDLPLAEPEVEWECNFCSYRERCGEGERHTSDSGTTGLLTRYTGYPREKLVEYLEVYPEAKLTPSLAFEHPDLSAKFGVYDWQCKRCDNTYEWDVPEWGGDVTQPPRCPDCFEGGLIELLCGPAPDDQVIGGEIHAAE